jgi:dipeptidase D
MSNLTHNHQIIANLEPSNLWSFFAELANIPRPSLQEEGVRNWLKNFATERNLDYKQDAIGNLFIYKPAQNSTSSNTVLLQAHMDMVCEKDPEIVHNFDTDSIVLREENGFIYATGTTLGSDNGIGLVSALCILDDLQISHPTIEAAFTMNEETGMDGIMNLDKSLISANYVLNLDTEEEGSVYVSSAGSRDIEIVINPQTVQISSQKGLNIKISGLRGGHSGVNIHENRLNSNKILSYILSQVQSQIVLSEVQGGSKRNAIPRNSQASILVLNGDELGFIKSKLEQIAGKITSNYIGIEPNIKIQITENLIDSHFEIQASQRVISLLNAIHSGVYQMSSVVPNLVQTSNNVGVIESDPDGNLTICNMLRSNDDYELEVFTNQILSVVKGVFGVSFGSFDKKATVLKDENNTSIKVVLSPTTSGWKAESDNPLLEVFQSSHTKITGQPAVVKAVHAGLECGFLKEYLPHSKIISFGPQIDDAHSPKEHVKISSVQEFYTILIDLIQVL